MAEFIPFLTSGRQFILELFLTGIFYSSFFPKHKWWKLKMAGMLVLMFCCDALLQNLPMPLQFYVNTLVQLGLFAVLISVALWVDVKTQGFVVLSSVTTQHMAVCFGDVLACLCHVPQNNWVYVGISVFSFLFTLLLADRILHRRLQMISKYKVHSSKMIPVSLLVYGVVHELRIASLSIADLLEVPDDMYLVLHLYSLVGTFGAMALLYAFDREIHLIEEREMIEQVLHSREQQQKYYTQTIDLINLKYHDLKHQLALLRKGSQEPESSEAIGELERTVRSYDRFIITGNNTLDAVLTEKNIYCEGHEVTLNVMVKGELLGFLTDTDLCSLFGNILENAIEAVQELPIDSRLVILKVFNRGGYVCIHQENACAATPILENGIPKTTKVDTRFHGFGMKSIQYIVEKYQGHLTITCEHGRYSLDILIPIPTESEVV